MGVWGSVCQPVNTHDTTTVSSSSLPEVTLVTVSASLEHRIEGRGGTALA